MAVSIDSGGTTSTGIFTFADGEVEDIKTNLSGEIDIFPTFGAASTGTLLFDIGGSLKKIVIRGVLFETAATRVPAQSVATIAEQRSWLEGLLDGQQVATHSLTTDFETSLGVMVEKIDFSEKAGESANQLPFTISLVAGTL